MIGDANHVPGHAPSASSHPRSAYRKLLRLAIELDEEIEQITADRTEADTLLLLLPIYQIALAVARVEEFFSEAEAGLSTEAT